MCPRPKDVLRDPMWHTITFPHGRNLSVSHPATDSGLSVAATSQLIEKLVPGKLAPRRESAVDRSRKQPTLTGARRHLLGKMESP